jgi:hypothetical protein
MPGGSGVFEVSVFEMVNWRMWGRLSTYALVFAFVFMFHSSSGLWDFNVYYYAGKAYNEGLNFYDRDVLSELSSGRVGLPYVYPPMTIWVFSPLAWFDAGTARFVDGLLKGFSVILILHIGSKLLDSTQWVIAYFALFFIAYNNSFHSSIETGNIDVYITALILAGIYSLYRGRPGFFSACILAAWAFKIVPVFFLVLLLFSGNRRGRVWFMAGLMLFSAYLGLGYLISPDLFGGYVGNFSSQALEPGERGWITPSVYPLINDVLLLSGFHEGLSLGFPGVTALLYALWTVNILLISFFACRGFRGDCGQRKKIIWLFSCVVYAIIMPRFKCYSFILLVLPACYLLGVKGFSLPVMGVFIVSLAPVWAWLSPMFLPSRLVEYNAFYTAFLVWVFYVVRMSWHDGVERPSRDEFFVGGLVMASALMVFLFIAFYGSYFFTGDHGVLRVVDRLNVGDPESESSHNYSISGGTWEGVRSFSYGGGSRIASRGRAYVGWESFDSSALPGSGLLVCKRHTTEVINQSVDVYADGFLVGRWAITGGRGGGFFRNSCFMVDREYVISERVNLRFEYVSGIPDVNSFMYWMAVV